MAQTFSGYTGEVNCTERCVRLQLCILVWILVCQVTLGLIKLGRFLEIRDEPSWVIVYWVVLRSHTWSPAAFQEYCVLYPLSLSGKWHHEATSGFLVVVSIQHLQETLECKILQASLRHSTEEVDKMSVPGRMPTSVLWLCDPGMTGIILNVGFSGRS